jgi:hypothetical protein
MTTSSLPTRRELAAMVAEFVGDRGGVPGGPPRWVSVRDVGERNDLSPGGQRRLAHLLAGRAAIQRMGFVVHRREEPEGSTRRGYRYLVALSDEGEK